MSLTITKLTEKPSYEGHRVVEATFALSSGTAANVNIQTQLGLAEVDEVWVKCTNDDADSVAVTSALPAYKGGTDITFDSTGALTFQVRFLGS